MSESLGSIYATRLLINDTMISGPINITGSTISGLKDPVTLNDLSNKNYVDTKFGINGTIVDITANENITYTSLQVIGNTINRYTNRYTIDKFPNDLSEVLTSKSINYSECIIKNISTEHVLTIDLFQESINIIIGTVTVDIMPNNLAIFKIIKSNGNGVDIYVNIGDSSSSIFLKNSLTIDVPIKTTNIFSKRLTALTITSSKTYDPEEIINTLITRTTSGILDTFPSKQDILDYMNNINELQNNNSFKTIIRNNTGSSIQMGSNTGILFNFISPFFISNDTSCTFLFIYIDNNFQVYIEKITNFDNNCTIS